jgi:hypothetical protein
MPPYIDAAYFRANGFTADPPDDDALEAAVLIWQPVIERITKQWFDEREITFRFDGNGSDTIHFGVPIIEITSLKINDSTVALDADAYAVYKGRSYPDDRHNPRIKLKNGSKPDIFTSSLGDRKFLRGVQNCEVAGTFGYLDDGEDPMTDDPVTPEPIKRALMKLVIEKLLVPVGPSPSPPLPALIGAIIEEQTDDHRIKYALPGGASFETRRVGLSGLTMDQEILDILKLYRAPLGVSVPNGSLR